MKGLTPLMNCKCLEYDTLSSIKIITKLAGINDMAKIMHTATTTSALLLNLKIITRIMTPGLFCGRVLQKAISQPKQLLFDERQQ